MAFWAFISFHFGLLGLHFILAFWALFPFILACLGCHVNSHHKLPKMARFLNVPHKEFNSARSGYIFQFLAFWAFIFFHFGLLGLHFFAFWPFGLSFFHFGLWDIQYLRERRRQNRQRADQGPNLWATKPGENYMLTAAASPPNLEKIPQNRQRADQGPNLWATKPGENCMLTAAVSKKPPQGRPRSKPMGHQTWRKLHAYGSNGDETANGQTKAQSRSRS